MQSSRHCWTTAPSPPAFYSTANKEVVMPGQTYNLHPNRQNQYFTKGEVIVSAAVSLQALALAHHASQVPTWGFQVSTTHPTMPCQLPERSCPSWLFASSHEGLFHDLNLCTFTQHREAVLNKIRARALSVPLFPGSTVRVPLPLMPYIALTAKSPSPCLLKMLY